MENTENKMLQTQNIQTIENSNKLLGKKSKRSGVGKIIFMGFIFLILLIFNFLINSKLGDRRASYNSAVYNISNGAGSSFDLAKLYLEIPGKQEVPTYSTYKKTEDKTIFLAPKKSDIKMNLVTEKRSIGIYSAPVFTGDVEIKVLFDLTDINYIKDAVYDLQNSTVNFNCESTHFLSLPEFYTEGKKIGNIKSGQKEKIFVVTALTDLSKIKEKLEVTIKMKIRGAEEAFIYIFASETKMHIDCDWPYPSFAQDSFVSKKSILPVEYKIDDKGFSADWYVPFDSVENDNRIGFSFLDSDNVYKKVERSIKYGFLFIVIPFIILFLIEIIGNINIHPVNYLLCGASSLIFFLLLLSLSEQINFGVSYLIAAFASSILITLYVLSITKKIKYGIIMAGMFVILYCYLYFCLLSEDYAFLMGVILTFIVLAMIMFITRKVDWSTLKKKPQIDLIKE